MKSVRSDYRCDGCGHAFEAMQRMSEDPLRECPSCKKESLRRLIGAGGALIFKGTGFYCTDYKKPRQEPKKDSS
jgi:putative FmdB family regulatory protein